MNKVNQFFQIGAKYFRREKKFAILNIIGLSLGIFFFLVTALYVQDELSTDQWHEQGENIYLPKQVLETPTGSVMLMPSYAMGPTWKEESPGVLDWTNISQKENKKYEVNNESFETDGFYYSNSGLFRMFDFSLALGDESKALEEPNSIIISEELREKHFGSNNPLGQTINLEGLGDYMITGVLNKIPSNSHLQFDMITPINLNEGPYKGNANNWQYGHGLHYILLQPDYSFEALAADTKAMIKKYTEKESQFDFSFDKFTDLYMSGGTVRNTEGMFAGQEKYLIIFSVVGGLLLLVASFNYINLTTARAFSRTRDFAVRKIMGSRKAGIIRLQLTETFIIAFVSLIISVIAIELTLPFINSIFGKRLSLNIISRPDILLIPAAVLLLVIVISGIYPAIVGSKVNVAQALKGNTSKSSGVVIRKVLIVLQFMICAGVLSSTLIIRSQANYLINKDLGYNATNIMNINLTQSGAFGSYEKIKHELSRYPVIEQMASAPLPKTSGIMFVSVGEGEEKQNKMVSYGSADRGFMDLFGLELMAGKSFKEATDSELKNGILINEAALTYFDTENVIGEELSGTEYIVLGVVKDFHFNSTKAKISPMIIVHTPDQFGDINLKFRNGDYEEVQALLTSTWDQLGFEKAPQGKLIENYFADSYQREQILIQIFDILTFALLVVATLGLLAIAILEGQLRQKELSIRKVLGANYLSLLKKLNMPFIVLIAISLVITIPVTQWLIGSWLNDFPYRIDSTYQFYGIAGLTVVCIALIILSIQGLNRLKENPAEVLRNE